MPRGGHLVRPASLSCLFTVTPEELRYAEANTILRWKGDDAPMYVADRIGDLALAGDWAGVERFREIARCLSDLMGLDVPTRQ